MDLVEDVEFAEIGVIPETVFWGVFDGELGVFAEGFNLLCCDWERANGVDVVPRVVYCRTWVEVVSVG